MSAAPTYLTPDQVYSLNEKYGYFEFADAQGDKSRDFAQDAIAMHERIRAAAQDMLAALKAVDAFISGAPDAFEPFGIVRAAIAKATGAEA